MNHQLVQTMKPKTMLIASLTALLTSICAAQVTETRYSPAAGPVAQNPGATITGSAGGYSPVAQTTPLPPSAVATPRPAGQVRSTAGKTYSDRLVNVIARTNPRARTMVIPKEAADAKVMEQVDEDMVVMAHILEKAVSNEDKVTRAMGIAVTKWGSSAPQNLFIENHGAIFFMDVSFPLLPPPAKEKEPVAKEQTNSEWEVARRELTEPAKGPWRRSPDIYGLEAGSPLFFAGPTPAYDAGKVEELKKRVLAALKNAGHIRKLKADDTITVVIQGPGAVADKPAKSSADSNLESDSDPFATGLAVPAPIGSTAQGTAKLIVRVRKADAESFENGKMDLDDFRKKAAVMLY